MTETRPRTRRPRPAGRRLTRAVVAVTVLSLPAILFLDVFLVVVTLSLLVGAVLGLAGRMLRAIVREATEDTRATADPGDLRPRERTAPVTGGAAAGHRNGRQPHRRAHRAARGDRT